MKGIKRTLALFICFTLALSLASCAQGQVNENRLPGGVTDGPDPGGVTEDPGNDTKDPGNDTKDPGNDTEDPGDDTQHRTTDDEGNEIIEFEFDRYANVENNTFEDTRGYEGGGTVLYTVTSAKLYDSLADAGISEESYAASGEEKYDHYVKVDMTVKNVDVTDLGKEYNANNFRLQGHVYFKYETPVWFSLGGQANNEKMAYFHYHLPPAGETMEISIAFGLSDSFLELFRESDGVWLTYTLKAPRLQRMKLENVI